jgi:hypothetical protein
MRAPGQYRSLISFNSVHSVSHLTSGQQMNENNPICDEMLKISHFCSVDLFNHV